MEKVTTDDIRKSLQQVRDPDLGRDIVSLGFIKNLEVTGGQVRFDLNLTTPACPVKDQLKTEAEDVVKKLPGVTKVDINLTAEVRRTVAIDKSGVKGVRNFVAIASGKGGVGKSTVAVNLAVAMAQTGSRVGLLDADIYGPTVPLMMGKDAKIEVTKDNIVIPALAHNVKFVSMGFMAPGDKPLIWRGPMAHHALQQTIFQTQWGELDYLFLDLPPGTGDVHLTLTQSLRLTGAVIVTTPQDVGLIISLKTYQMFKTTNVRILGLIENMSSYICPHCGKEEDIFGQGGGERVAQEKNIPFLGKIPLNKKIRENADQGRPTVLDQSSPISTVYKTIVGKLAQQVSIASYDQPKLEVVEEKTS